MTGAKASFGAWVNRDDTVGHPQAPPGLRHAWVNAKYSVQQFLAVCDWGDVTLLMIRRHDDAPITQWYELQRIKNELVGPERTAVQVFPPQKDLRDEANMYHLWVLPAGMTLPFGLHRQEQWQAQGSRFDDASAREA